MKKAIKIIVGIVVVFLILLVGFIVSLAVTIGPLVKSAAAKGGPHALGVNMSVGDVKLRPLAGKLTITDVKIGNPEGYSEKDSFAVKTVDVALKTKSLFQGDTIYIEKILIEAPAILYETKDGTSNFEKMLEKAKRAETEDKEKDDPKDADGKPKKKVIIEEFVLQDSKVAYSSKVTFGKPITVPLPTIKVNDIGKNSGGVTGVEALGRIFPEIVGGLKDAVAGAVTAVGGTAVDAAKQGTDAAKAVAEDATKTAKDAAGAATDAAKDAAGKLKGLFGK